MSGRTVDEAQDLLLEAMRSGDADALQELLSHALVFTLPDGSDTSRDADLAAHRSGATRFESLEEHERRTEALGGMVRTSAPTHVVVIDRGERIEADLTYERSWSIIDGRWQVVSGCAVVI